MAQLYGHEYLSSPELYSYMQLASCVYRYPPLHFPVLSTQLETTIHKLKTNGSNKEQTICDSHLKFAKNGLDLNIY